jgi:ArsR family metal-binding transcriptional regulator
MYVKQRSCATCSAGSGPPPSYSEKNRIELIKVSKCMHNRNGMSACFPYANHLMNLEQLMHKAVSYNT